MKHPHPTTRLPTPQHTPHTPSPPPPPHPPAGHVNAQEAHRLWGHRRADARAGVLRVHLRHRWGGGLGLGLGWLSRMRIPRVQCRAYKQRRYQGHHSPAPLNQQPTPNQHHQHPTNNDRLHARSGQGVHPHPVQVPAHRLQRGRARPQGQGEGAALPVCVCACVCVCMEGGDDCAAAGCAVCKTHSSPVFNPPK